MAADRVNRVLAGTDAALDVFWASSFPGRIYVQTSTPFIIMRKCGNLQGVFASKMTIVPLDEMAELIDVLA